MTYEDKLRLAQQHLLVARQQTQAALELLCLPPDRNSLEGYHFARVALVASIGDRNSEVIEDINCQLGAAEDYSYEQSEFGD